jgi:nicotinate phosphoribosyltransferase
MINSILDTDLYKFTTMFAILSNKELSNLDVKYEFINRNNVKFPDKFDYYLEKEIQNLTYVALTKSEKQFLMKKCGSYLPDWFLDFLEGYTFNPNEVTVNLNNGDLSVIIEGKWYRSVLWETPLMAIISELYFEMTDSYDFDDSNNRKIRQTNNLNKAKLIIDNNLKVSEFGTRRRFSYENQKEVIEDFLSYDKNTFTGTSNVHFAHMFNLNPHGTHPHEWSMCHAALYGYKMATTISLDNWVNSYQGNLGTALTDCYTTDIFLQSFGAKYSKLFDSCRHDSGNPYEYVDKIVNHYNSLKIDPKSKSIIFSDGLDMNSAISIKKYCDEKGINSAFGVGTNLSNNLQNVKPLNIVIKITYVKVNNIWQPAVKLSDNKGKHTGEKSEIELCKRILEIGEISYDKKPAGNEND